MLLLCLVTPALEQLARRYLWWEPPERALAQRDRLLCQILQLGTWEDVRLARTEFGEAALREALFRAPAGALDARSWNFWHLSFGLPVPPMPARPLP